MAENQSYPETSSETGSETTSIAREVGETNIERRQTIDERNVARRRINYQSEILAKGPKDVEELVYAVQVASFKEAHLEDIGRKYGRGFIGKTRAFLAGEFDVGIGKDDEVRRSGWNKTAEAGRRALMTVFNRRTAAATGAAVIMGVLTGGAGTIGSAAAGVIFGSMGGRAMAETISAVRAKETGARENILLAERERWYEMRKMAEELEKITETEQKFQLLNKMTELYFKQGQAAVLDKLRIAEEKFSTVREAQDKSRGRWQMAGEILGGIGGTAYGFITGHFAAVDIDLWNKVDGQSLTHELIKVDGKWHFIRRAAEVATGQGGEAARQIVALGGRSAHLLGEPAWKIAAATIVERAVPVLMSAVLAGRWGKKIEERRTVEGVGHLAEMDRRVKERVEGTLPRRPASPAPAIEPTGPAAPPVTAVAAEVLPTSPPDETQLRKLAQITLSRVKSYEDLNAPDKEAAEQKFIAKTRELWTDIVLHEKPDLDARTAWGILKLAGINVADLREVTKVSKGKYQEGAINIDTGERHGVAIENEGKTAFLDHHGPESGRDTSATQITYDAMVELGLLAKQDYLDKLAAFVTKIDNRNYTLTEQDYKNSWRTLQGLQGFVRFDKLREFFERGSDPEAELSAEDLKNLRLDRASETQKRNIAESWQAMEQLRDQGFIVSSDRYGQIAVDIGKKVRAGDVAAEAFGCQTYINWSPELQSFFISSKNLIAETYRQGKNIRGTMWIKPPVRTPGEGENLTMTLSEVLQKMTNGKLAAEKELKKYLDQEKAKKAA